MKKEINRRFAGIAVFTIVITTIVMAGIFYSRLKAQVFSDLKVIAALLAESADYERLPENIRVTVIDADGTVYYDSAADADTLANHLDRPEVKEAFEKGFGQEVRRSGTLSKDIFYYALLTDGGQVVRVGKEYANVAAVMMSAFPVMLGMMLVLAAVCMAMSHYLTAAIVEPIDTLAEDMNHIDEAKIYEELAPFMRKIRLQHEEILSAANIRQEFTANVTHELKTPLTVISGYAELMETGVAKAEDVKRFSREIRKSAARLLNLINDILKLSKLDAGYQAELLEKADLAVIARDTAEMLSINAAKQEVTVSYRGCGTAKVRIGRELAEEVAYNLIENAVRYNKKGGEVVVSVSNEDNGILFQVSDTGIGIPAEHQERIFERFYRVDKSRSKELGGTGLGLAIVKHICDLTGGKVTLTSAPDAGTTVSILWGQETEGS